MSLTSIVQALFFLAFGAVTAFGTFKHCDLVIGGLALAAGILMLCNRPTSAAK